MKKTMTKKSQAIHRIKIIQGHLKGVQNMLENGSYCVDIIHQSIAVQKALKKLDMHIMENHLKNCVITQMKNGHSQKSIRELLGLYEMK